MAGWPWLPHLLADQGHAHQLIVSDRAYAYSLYLARPTTFTYSHLSATPLLDLALPRVDKGGRVLNYVAVIAFHVSDVTSQKHLHY